MSAVSDAHGAALYMLPQAALEDEVGVRRGHRIAVLPDQVIDQIA